MPKKHKPNDDKTSSEATEQDCKNLNSEPLPPDKKEATPKGSVLSFDDENTVTQSPKKSSNNRMNNEISMFGGARATVGRRCTVYQALKMIRTGGANKKLAKKVKKIRQLLEDIKDSDDEKEIKQLRSKAAKLKKSLPAFTFSGSFEYRNTAGFIKHSGLVVLDLDKVDDVEAVCAALLKMPTTFCVFRSVSNKGVKALVSAELDCDVLWDEDVHKAAYAKVKTVYSEFEQYIDESGSDVCRLCFGSHDEAITVRRDAEAVLVTGEDLEPFTGEIDLSTTSAKKQRKAGLKKQKKREQKYSANLAKLLPTYPLSVAETALKAIALVNQDIDYTVWVELYAAMFNSYGEDGVEVMMDVFPAQDDDDYTKNDKLHATLSVGTVFDYAKKIAKFNLKHHNKDTDLFEIQLKELAVSGLIDDWYYDTGTSKFLHLNNKKRFFAESGQAAKESLTALGIVDRDLRAAMVNYIKLERSVNWYGDLAGYEQGIYSMNGMDILVATSPHFLEPVEGSYPLIKEFIERMLAGEQLEYFYAWLSRAVEMLTQCLDIPVQAVAFVGGRGCGKSFLQELMLTPLFGGRQADPTMFFKGDTRFNSDLIGSEHACVSDTDGSLSRKDRVKLGAGMKQIVANNSAPNEGKFKDKVSLTPRRVLTFSLNTEQEDVGVLPPMKDSIADKIHLFYCADGEMPMPTNTPEEMATFLSAIQAELPMFLNFLLSGYEQPTAIVDSRWGVKSYHHPEVLKHLDELDGSASVEDFIKTALRRRGKAIEAELAAKVLTHVKAELNAAEAQVFNSIVSGIGSMGSHLGKLSKSVSWISAKSGKGGNRWTVKVSDEVQKQIEKDSESKLKLFSEDEDMRHTLP